MLLSALGASLLGNLLTSKKLKKSKVSSRMQGKLPGRKVMRVGEVIVRAGQDF